MCRFRLKYGLFILIFDGISIGIKQNAKFWKLPAAKKKEVMRETREQLKYAEDFEMFDRFLGCGFDFSDPQAIEQMFVAMNRINENPFMLAGMKEACREEFEKFEAKLQKRKSARSPQKGLRKNVYARDEGRCRYCGELTPANTPLDHVIPYSLGGKTEYENLVVSCKPCNLKKLGRTPEQAGMKLRELPKKNQQLCAK